MGERQSERSGERGVGMILLKPDHVLMVRRGKQPFLGHWSYPGGMVEAGETPQEAAVRELMEETGLVAAAVRLVGEHIVQRAAPASGTFTLHVFTGLWQSGEPIAADDAAEARFFAFEEISGLETTPRAEYWLKRALSLKDRTV